MKNSITKLKLRGKSIRFDENGMACLNDIWKAAGFSKNQTPGDWLRLETVKRYLVAAYKQQTGKSRLWTKKEMGSVLYTKRGEGAFANAYVSLEYARYLNPALALEVNEVFLRHKSGDATLADETLQKATPEENEWAGKRALGRSKRKEFTSTLKEHGVKGWGYAKVTDASYDELFNRSAKQLRQDRRVSKYEALRDNFTMDEVAAVFFAESLSSQRIENENSFGNAECTEATRKSSRIVRAAIDENRKD